MAGWTVTELGKQLGLKLQTISGWITAELVVPEEFRRGRGGHVIGLQGMLELITVSELRRVGFSTRQIRKAVNNLRALTGLARPLAQLTLVVTGNDIAWKEVRGLDELQFKAISALRAPGQCVLIFPIGEMQESLLRQLEECEKAAEKRERMPIAAT